MPSNAVLAALNRVAKSATDVGFVIKFPEAALPCVTVTVAVPVPVLATSVESLLFGVLYVNTTVELLDAAPVE